MCGICGIFDPAGHREITHQGLQRMADTMVHRGPDDAGSYISPDRRIGFGFRRLSIVDISGGRQPMNNASCPRRGQASGAGEGQEAGTVWVIYNGEIYNHEELRQELEAKGHVYATRSDTESIVHGYEEWGEGVVRRLRGMFAFAIYDGRIGDGQRLFLARDRLGIKPLYYTQQQGLFLFASEIKAVLAWPGIQREVDAQALSHYLALSFAPPPLTLFRNVCKLPPGHALSIYPDGSHKLQQYWDPLTVDVALNGASEADLVQKLRDMLRESIRLRMMSDVPFGVFLSGGVDSSLNLALMAELMDRPVDTFSVAIQGDALSDERSQARRVADYFGAKYHEVVISPQDFVDFLPRMAYYQDEPLPDPVNVPLYFVSKLARDSGTIVVQVGEGADELFAGYTGYATMADFYRRLYAPFAALPRWMKLPAASLAQAFLPARRAEYVRRAAAGEELFWGGSELFPERLKHRLLSNGASSVALDTYAQVIAPSYRRFDGARPGRTFLDRIIYLELKFRLPELLLMRVDKMSMAASVEARVPYLDHELVEFAMAIPSALKYKNGRTKHILKEAARGILPDDVINRPKTGFCGGSDNMVSPAIVDHAEKVIAESQWLQGLINPRVVHSLVAGYRSGRLSPAMPIWSLLNLALWHRTHIEQKVTLPFEDKPIPASTVREPKR